MIHCFLDKETEYYLILLKTTDPVLWCPFFYVRIINGSIQRCSPIFLRQKNIASSEEDNLKTFSENVGIPGVSKSDELTEYFSKYTMPEKRSDLSPKMQVDRYKTHDIEIVIDRLAIARKDHKRVKDSIAMALKQGNGVMMALTENEELSYFSKNLSTYC